MAEQTQAPVAPVAQEAPTDEQRMARYLEQYDQDPTDVQYVDGRQPEAAPAPQVAQQPEDPAAPDELSPDDIPDDPVEAQSAVDEFEIVHNGTQRKLTRAETIQLAQQGFDYTQKTQAVAEQAKLVQSRLQRINELEQIQPILAQDHALVASLEAQLAPYQKVDWVQVATNDPLGYSQARAQYDVLVTNYQQAVGGLTQKSQFYQHRKQQLVAETRPVERQKLAELVPEWKDATRYASEAAEVKSYLVDRGLDPQLLDSLGDNAGDANLIAIARDATMYRRLLKAKTEKVKQLRTAPPVTRPGSAQSQSATKVDKAQESMRRLGKTGNVEDAAAALLNRWS